MQSISNELEEKKVSLEREEKERKEGRGPPIFRKKAVCPKISLLAAAAVEWRLIYFPTPSPPLSR